MMRARPSPADRSVAVAPAGAAATRRVAAPRRRRARSWAAPSRSARAYVALIAAAGRNAA